MNSKNAVLNLTVATTATFQTEGITGAITLTFTPNGTFEQRSSGHTTLKLVDRMIKYHGWWSYAAAAFTGRIMNIDVAGPYGQLGETRQRELIIERSVK